MKFFNATGQEIHDRDEWMLPSELPVRFAKLRAGSKSSA
jgi:hypothetical protein